MFLVQEDDKEGGFDEDDEEVEDMSQSVDITLEDDAYADQVTEQIISPNTPVTEWEEERKRMEKVVGQTAKSLPVFSFEEKEEEIAMARSIEKEEYEEEEKDQEREEEGEENQEEGEEGEENQEEGEKGEERENNEEEESNGEDGSVVSYDRMGSEYSGSSCRTDEDLDSLEWVKNITLFSFLHEYGDTAASDQLMEEKESLSHAALIDQLQVSAELESFSGIVVGLRNRCCCLCKDDCKLLVCVYLVFPADRESTGAMVAQDVCSGLFPSHGGRV